MAWIGCGDARRFLCGNLGRLEVGGIGGEVHRFTATMAVRPETPVEKRIRELVKAKNKKVGSRTELFITAEEIAQLRALPCQEKELREEAQMRSQKNTD